jgi:beta-lactamase regulating signal transducer with metallopeptidase domain
MLDVLRPGESIPWDYLWQSTLFLAVGLAASLVMVRRPARAHRLLLLAVLATLFTPLLAQAARRGGWGLLARPAEPPSSRISGGMSEAPVPAGGAPFTPLEAAFEPARPGAPSRVSSSPPVESPEVASGPAPTTGEPRADSSGGWLAAALGAWLILSGLAAARLLVSLPRGLRVMRRARPTEDDTLTAAAASAAARLGLTSPPALRWSPSIRGPVIWCWGRRPVILVPESMTRISTVDCAGVFCHELAHRVRKDHWSGLLAELLICLLPWHPLAWLARHRLNQLSELACDDWALSAGVPAADYAEALLSLVPQRRTALALAAVSSRRGLIGRVRHILDERPIAPAVGRRWAFASGVTVALAVSAVALAQTRPQDRKEPDGARPKPAESANATNVEKEANKMTAERRSAHGQVLDPAGKPVPGAEVLWVAYHNPEITPSVMPKGEESWRSRPPTIVARSRVDANGQYTIGGDFNPAGFVSHFLLVTARGFGPQSHYFKSFGKQPDDSRVIDADVTFRLVPEAIIRGRLLTPLGTPASGVRVSLNWFQYNDEGREGMSVGRMATDDEVPSYWPHPRRTDTDGRFTLEGVPQGAYAYLTSQHPDYAMEDLTVNTAIDGSTNPRLSDFAPHPAGVTFTHTLEPARPVQGRVTDKATGKPLVGILVEMISMGRHGGSPFYTHTDADGRYRISGHQGGSYDTTVYPPGGSGYLAASDRQQGWPAGAKVLQKDFALERGRIIIGHVIDAGTKQPVAGAAVIYRPRPGNPDNRNGSADIPNSVLTRADGQFAITGLPGEGTLLVETSGGYVRTRFPQGRHEQWNLFPHGLADVNVPDQGEAAPAEIAVRKGVTYSARVVGPDGKPVSPFGVFCPGLTGSAIHRGRAVDYPDDRFIFPGADPNRTYRAIFASARHRLAAVVEIKPDPANSQSAEIRLQPAARVHGKVVNPSGTPMLEGQVYPMIVLDKNAESLKRDEVLSQEFYSNLLESSARQKYWEKPIAGGEFAHDALVPGEPFYIVASSGNREAFQYVSPLKPGEDRDLGTITLKERQR